MMAAGLFMMMLMIIGTVLVLVLIGVGIWLLARWGSRQSIPPAPRGSYPMTGQPSALEVLRERYARGEIDTATFEEMVKRIDAPRMR